MPDETFSQFVEDSSTSDLLSAVDSSNDILQSYSVVVEPDSQLATDVSNIAVCSLVIVFALGCVAGLQFFKLLIRGAYVRSF